MLPVTPTLLSIPCIATHLNYVMEAVKFLKCSCDYFYDATNQSNYINWMRNFTRESQLQLGESIF